jgi:hypothetical protein
MSDDRILALVPFGVLAVALWRMWAPPVRPTLHRVWRWVWRVRGIDVDRIERSRKGT